MSTIETSVLINSIAELLSEAYEGPRDANSTWFIDNERDAGIFGILKNISAEQASRSVDGSNNRGSTIAANVEHLRWSIANTNGAMLGQPYKSNWSESWDLSTTDTAAWDRLRYDLRAEFESLRATIQQQEHLSGVYLNGVLALIPHAAYHLGTIRQMIERVRS